MTVCSRLPVKRRQLAYSGLFLIMLLSSLVSPFAWIGRSQAQTSPYCQLSADAVAEKNELREQALEGDRQARSRYQNVLNEHAEQIRRCRNQSWLRNQAIWIRLYPCDAQAGVLEDILDRIVNRGYNQVYVEVFYNGQVLLPQAENRTPWPSTIRTPGHENVDLLAEAIAKGRERGLKVYAWMFMMNFGYSYAQRPGAEQVLAINGYGQTSLNFNASAGLNSEAGVISSEETFIDPYNNRAKQDYYALVQSVLQRRPDGVLFDYVRYPRGTGPASVASRVQDLWIYGSAAQQALYNRALNQKGRELIRRYISRGYINASDLDSLDSLYPNEGEPLWQGRELNYYLPTATSGERRPIIQSQLWRLTVAHAFQGVLDFLAMAALPVQRQGIPAGAVFFPDGNQTIGQGYDSRLQPWDRFSSSLEWHPMSYGVCGNNNTSCITALVQRVTTQAPPGTRISPVLAGTWGQSVSNRPSLEAQMQAIRQVAPQINSISHFAYSWQEPQSDRDRKFCQLR